MVTVTILRSEPSKRWPRPKLLWQCHPQRTEMTVQGLAPTCPHRMLGGHEPVLLAFPAHQHVRKRFLSAHSTQPQAGNRLNYSGPSDGGASPAALVDPLLCNSRPHCPPTVFTSSTLQQDFCDPASKTRTPLCALQTWSTARSSHRHLL